MDSMGCMWTLGLVCLSLTLGWTQGQSTNNYSRPVFHCGGNVDGDTGFVGSEGFPAFYKHDSKCTWYITVPEGNVVILTFRIFDLEADSLCRYDYLDVYNGHSNLVEKLGRFCGTFRPGTLMSTSNTMMLEMVSDSGTGGRGFLGYFQAGKPHADDQLCGGKYTKSQGSLQTPNWPQKHYPPGVTCSWLITVEPNMAIEVNFEKFTVEGDTYCRFDYVALYNGGEREDSRRIGKYCGEVPPKEIVSNGNVLLVQFVSDTSVTSDGFMATYRSIPRGSKPPTTGEDVVTGPRVGSESRVPVVRTDRPVKPEKSQPRKPTAKPATTTTTTTTVRPTPKPKPVRPVRPARPVKPQRRPVTKPENGKPTRTRAPLNPLCAQACKRDGNIKASYCASEFAITARLTAVTPKPGGGVQISATLIKAYKAGRLTITQAGADMSIKMVSMCQKCPVLRRGGSYILMGQVDEDGRGTLAPGSFTALYKAPHHKILTNISNQPC
ncbi:procollagen C-endopeptidase enhancer a [Sardina pilchardus]|uniref:procollagen C-endopeptidase enhancer a n=1 Tax=Sardina pilchardus TaxID=27697 RepID=UPI002E0D6215